MYENRGLTLDGEASILSWEKDNSMEGNLGDKVRQLEKFAPVWAAVCGFFERGGILFHPALETRCAAFVAEVDERPAFSGAVGSVFREITKDERKSRINTRRRQRRRKSHKRPQCGRFLGARFRGQIQREKEPLGSAFPQVTMTARFR